MAELPYQAEYAKSGRASCKGCKEKIEQGTLRIAIMVQSAFFDGKQPNWHHEECFFKKQHPKTYADIANFNKLKNDDQKKIKAAIDNNTGIVMPVQKGKGKKRVKDTSTDMALKDFLVEYSKSSRATCRHCDIKICKDEVRISKMSYDTEIGASFGGQPLWHHVKCFVEKRTELLYFAGGEDIPGYKSLKKDDQKMVKAEIKPLKSDEVPIKKLKPEPKDEIEMKEEKEKEKKIEKQNILYHKHRDALSELKRTDLVELLEANSQEVPSGTNECLDRLADCMAFGALKPCPECKEGQLVLDTYGYKCTGNISEWTKCSYITQNPKRVAMKIPKAYKDGTIFKTVKKKTDIRLFDTAPRPIVIVKEEQPMSIKKELPIPPLKNLQFFLYGSLDNKEEIKKRVLKLGGLVVPKLTDTTVAVITTKKDVEKKSAKMKEIEEKNIEVVEATYLDLIDPKSGTIANSLQLIVENNIADWGSNPNYRLPQDVLDGKSIAKSGSMYVKSTKSTSTRLKVQEGTVVDPASNLENEAHVYIGSDGTKYTVVLCKADVMAQKNSYYKLQVLEKNDKKKYWLFRSWGRIGTTIGGHKLEKVTNVGSAIEMFESYYKEKTQNEWELRDSFTKVPDCYFPLDVDYSNQNESNMQLTVESKLPIDLSVQLLIMKIFDTAIMKSTLLEFELDTEKMPLGKLSKQQIKSAYKVLSELLDLIDKGNASSNKIIDATNRFFTLVPHDYGINNPPLLNNVDLIKKKTDMLDNLLEIEIAYNLMKSDYSESGTHPIEANYNKLKTIIAPLSRDSEEFAMIQIYVNNTHASTHSSYTLEIEEVFKVVREGENKRYKPFKNLHNRRLLWHGSRVSNFAGILSQGLRIAPPEAPATGYMFGKGIYFADMVSKSANYCCTNKSNPVGIMLLCEVALGNMKKCYGAENVQLKKNKHSTFGVGRTEPDPAMNLTLDDGTMVPLGTPVEVINPYAQLLYNEYVVYDVAQVNVKYLLQMKFNYKY